MDKSEEMFEFSRYGRFAHVGSRRQGNQAEVTIEDKAQEFRRTKGEPTGKISRPRGSRNPYRVEPDRIRSRPPRVQDAARAARAGLRSV